MTYWHRWTMDILHPRSFYPRSAGHTHIVAIQFFPTWRQIMRATAGNSGSSSIFILFLSKYDVTCMAYSPPPSSGKSIHTFNGGCGERKRDRRKEGGLMKRRHLISLLSLFIQYVTQDTNLLLCIIWVQHHGTYLNTLQHFTPLQICS